jgi:hypothetical protein
MYSDAAIVIIAVQVGEIVQKKHNICKLTFLKVILNRLNKMIVSTYHRKS